MAGNSGFLQAAECMNNLRCDSLNSSQAFRWKHFKQLSDCNFLSPTQADSHTPCEITRVCYFKWLNWGWEDLLYHITYPRHLSFLLQVSMKSAICIVYLTCATGFGILLIFENNWFYFFLVVYELLSYSLSSLTL